MKKDRELQDRLNGIKSGVEPIKPAPVNNYTWTDTKVANDGGGVRHEIFYIIGKQVGIVIASILYGFAFSAIFSQDWNFFEILGVGFLFKQSSAIIISGIRKLFNKSKV